MLTMAASRDGDAVRYDWRREFLLLSCVRPWKKLHPAGGAAGTDHEMWSVCDGSDGELRGEFASCNLWRWRRPRGAQAACNKAAGVGGWVSAATGVGGTGATIDVRKRKDESCGYFCPNPAAARRPAENWAGRRRLASPQSEPLNPPYIRVDRSNTA